jgi:hypothetical protein
MRPSSGWLRLSATSLIPVTPHQPALRSPLILSLANSQRVTAHAPLTGIHHWDRRSFPLSTSSPTACDVSPSPCCRHPVATLPAAAVGISRPCAHRPSHTKEQNPSSYFPSSISSFSLLPSSTHHRITSFRHDITLQHITSHHITSHHITSHRRGTSRALILSILIPTRTRIGHTLSSSTAAVCVQAAECSCLGVRSDVA